MVAPDSSPHVVCNSGDSEVRRRMVGDRRHAWTGLPDVVVQDEMQDEKWRKRLLLMKVSKWRRG